MAFEFGFLLVLLSFSAFFSSTETGLFSLTQVQLLEFKKSRLWREKKVAELLDHPNQLLITILLGNNAVNIMLVLVSAKLLDRFSHSVYYPTSEILRLAIETLIITSGILLFGEIVPKAFALKHPKSVALAGIVPLSAFHRIIGFLKLRTQVLILVKGLLNAVRKVFGDGEESADHSDIQMAVGIGKREGHFTSKEAEMAHRILDLKELTAADILLDRSQVPSLTPEVSLTEALQIARKTGLESFPVMEKQSDQVLGVFHAAKAVWSSGKTVADCLEAAQFLPEVSGSEKWSNMIWDRPEKLWIVVDEFGIYTGVISGKMILDYLGFSYRVPGQNNLDGIDISGDGVRLQASTKIEILEEILQYSFPEGEYSTLGGYLIHQAGKIPQKGEWVVAGGWKFYIEQSEPNRILLVYIPRKGQYL